MGGSDSEAWTAETKRLTSVLRGKKVAAGKKMGESGGDVAKVMEQTQRRWNADGTTLLASGIHTFYVMVSDLASSSAAHARNIAAMNSPHMESWYKSHFNPDNYTGDVYKYILAQQLRPKEVEAFEESESRQRRMFDTQDMHHTKSACAQRMRKILDPYVPAKVKAMRWMEIPNILRGNRVRMCGLPTVDEFPLLGSVLSDRYRTAHWNKMYEAFTRPADQRIRLEELPELTDGSDDSALTIMVDHRGQPQHTIGSVDLAKSSNDWSKGARVRDKGPSNPVLDSGAPRVLTGKRRHEEGKEGSESDGIDGHGGAEGPSSDVEGDKRRKRKKKPRVRKSSSILPADMDDSPSATPVDADPHAAAITAMTGRSVIAPTALAPSAAAALLADKYHMSPPMQTLRFSTTSSTPFWSDVIESSSSSSASVQLPTNAPSIPTPTQFGDTELFDLLQKNYMLWTQSGSHHDTRSQIPPVNPGLNFGVVPSGIGDDRVNGLFDTYPHNNPYVQQP
jgi:hypothetical protein